jgi:hypothetical protein
MEEIKTKGLDMAQEQKSLPKWILIVSGLFALMEVGVGLSLFFSPDSVADKVDLQANGVIYVIHMWASRQLALGFILGFATYKKSIPMLTIAYLFLLVMFVCDLFIGIAQKDNALIMSAIVMSIISSVLIFLLNRRK